MDANTRYIKSISDNLGWINLFLFFIALSSCSGNYIATEVVIDGCEIQQIVEQQQ